MLPIFDGSRSDSADPLLTKTLLLTVIWDRPELASKVLARLDGKAGQAAAGSLTEITVAMQRALEMRRERVVPLFLALPGFSPKRINMGRLFLQPDKNKFLSHSPQLHKKARLLDNHGPFQLEVVDKRRVALNYFRYQKALFRFYHALSPVLAHLLRTTSATQPHDIFLWLVCQRCEAPQLVEKGLRPV